MRVCVPCMQPGGPDAVIDDRFEMTDVLDYYEFHEDGHPEHIGTMKNCGGAACVDPVEAIAHRGVRAVIVAGLGPGSLLRMHNYGMKVYRSGNDSVRKALGELAAGRLQEIKIEDFPKLSKPEE